MSVSILAKVKEFTEFWRDRLHELYEIEKSMPPLQGDELIPEIKREFCVAYFFIDQEEQKKDRFFADVMLNMANMGNAPLDLIESYRTLLVEIIQEWIKHIRYLQELKRCVEADNTTFKDFENVLDSAYDYFIDTYDGMSGALRCMKIDKSIREILSDEEALKNHYLHGEEALKNHYLHGEEALKNHYLQSLEYRNRMIGMYKKGLEDIETCLNEHAPEYDGDRIRLDVSEIIRPDVSEIISDVSEIIEDIQKIIKDIQKTADKAGEL